MMEATTTTADVVTVDTVGTATPTATTADDTATATAGTDTGIAVIVDIDAYIPTKYRITNLNVNELQILSDFTFDYEFNLDILETVWKQSSREIRLGNKIARVFIANCIDNFQIRYFKWYMSMLRRSFQYMAGWLPVILKIILLAYYCEGHPEYKRMYNSIIIRSMMARTVVAHMKMYQLDLTWIIQLSVFYGFSIENIRFIRNPETISISIQDDCGILKIYYSDRFINTADALPAIQYINIEQHTAITKLSNMLFEKLRFYDCRQNGHA